MCHNLIKRHADSELSRKMHFLLQVCPSGTMMKNDTYGDNFYKDRHQRTVYSAETVLSLVLEALPPIHSAIDFGCGVGTWLSVLREKHVGDIQGVDGPWVNLDLLKLPRENFLEANFEEPIMLQRRYDLAISLEVAEHVSQNRADSFIDSLVNAADFILFSAAIPLQGGRGHVNEQWPDYWACLFEKRGYLPVDFIRYQIWNDKKIPVWYRQNILLFSKKGRRQEIDTFKEKDRATKAPLSFVHPELYDLKVRPSQSLKGSWRLFRIALGKYIAKRMPWDNDEGFREKV